MTKKKIKIIDNNSDGINIYDNMNRKKPQNTSFDGYCNVVNCDEANNNIVVTNTTASTVDTPKGCCVDCDKSAVASPKVEYIRYSIPDSMLLESDDDVDDEVNLNKADVTIDDIRSFNIGNSDYSKHKIQPWDIWEEYNLNPWEADIVKRVLRTKKEYGTSYLESRIMDFEKIIHISRKCIEMLEKKL